MNRLYTRETAVEDDSLQAVASSVFCPEDYPLSVGNDEIGSRMFASAIDERRRTSATLFHPLAVFFQDEQIIVVPRNTVYFRIVTALPLHAETS